MAIASKPKRQTGTGDEKRVSEFINDGGSVPEKKKTGRVPVLVRLPAALLEQVDDAAGREFKTRTDYIISALVERLQG